MCLIILDLQNSQPISGGIKREWLNQGEAELMFVD